MKKINLKSIKPQNDIHYYRVSSDEQTKNFSLDNQTKYCTEFSQKSNHAVLQAFREEGESAKTADRTELQRMMKFAVAHKKQIARLVIYKVDRLSRKTEDYLAIKAFFKALGITIVSVSEKLEDNSAGKFLETILSAVAELDNNTKAERTVAGMKARLTKGLWSGTAPWGYINTTDKTGGKIIAPDPVKAPIVKMLFENYVTGKYSFRELAVMANKLGQKSRTGLTISKQLVTNIIRNPIYYGKIIVRKFEIDTMGIHQPIISEKLYSEANSENRGVAGRKQPRNLDNPRFPLRGIKCGGCGRNLTGGKTKSHTGKYYEYYNCSNQNCDDRTSIKKDSLEKDFTDFLAELTPNEEFFGALEEAIKIAHKIELESVTLLERKMHAKIVDLKAKKAKLLDLMIAEKITDKDFTDANQLLTLQIEELENELASLHTPELEIDSVIDTSIEFLKNLPKLWKTLDVKDLKVLRPLLFPQNVIYAYPGIKTHEVCPIYNVKSQSNTQLTHLVPSRGIEPRSTA